MAAPIQALGARVATLICLTLCLTIAGCITINTPLGSNGDNELHEAHISGHGTAKILWLPINGFISSRPSSHAFGLVRQASTLSRVTRALDKAQGDHHIKAVVLRIDSPGGTVAASDEIYHRIKRFEAKTGVPVIASLGGLAASGAYYVAVSANRIIAEPTTITGSIGVIIFDVSAAGLMHKLGLTDETVKSGPNKDSLSPLGRPSSNQRAILQNVVDALYRRFVSVVETNRPNLDHAKIKMITDGRIFAAQQARQLGLIDAIGHQSDVLAAARRTAGVNQARVIRYYQGKTAPKTLSADSAVDGLSSRGADSALRSLLDQPGAIGDAEPLYFWRNALIQGH